MSLATIIRRMFGVDPPAPAVDRPLLPQTPLDRLGEAALRAWNAKTGMRETWADIGEPGRALARAQAIAVLGALLVELTVETPPQSGDTE